jgi:hypothetical protein
MLVLESYPITTSARTCAEKTGSMTIRMYGGFQYHIIDDDTELLAARAVRDDKDLELSH